MPPTEPASSEPRCPECQAVLPSGARKCWLCGAAVPTSEAAAEIIFPRSASPSTPVESASGFSLASLMMFITLLCVVLGASTIAPGIGIPLGFFLLPIWIRTAAAARKRQLSGLPMTRPEKIHYFLSTAGFAFGTLALVTVAGTSALFGVCFTICAMGPSPDQSSFILYAFVAALLTVAAVSILVMLIRYRRRWSERAAGD